MSQETLTIINISALIKLQLLYFFGMNEKCKNISNLQKMELNGIQHTNNLITIVGYVYSVIIYQDDNTDFHVQRHGFYKNLRYQYTTQTARQAKH